MKRGGHQAPKKGGINLLRTKNFWNTLGDLRIVQLQALDVLGKQYKMKLVKNDCLVTKFIRSDSLNDLHGTEI